MTETIATLYLILSVALEALLWGSLSYILVILIARTDSKWWIGGIVSSVLFWLWYEVIRWGGEGLLMQQEGIHVSSHFWDNLVPLDFGRFLFRIATSIAGFVVARLLFKKANANAFLNGI